MIRKPPRRTRERILATSLRLFNEVGEPNVTTTAIAGELEISPGNLYYHFGNKEAIVDALFDEFHREIDPLLDSPLAGEPQIEDAWLFLHLLFEAIWRFRFVYRDLNDLLARNRRVEMRFRRIVERKMRAARALCRSLVARGSAGATDEQIESLATNMVVVTTYWLSFEFVRHPRSPAPTEQPAASMALGAWQVLSLLAPWLGDEDRRLFGKLAREYLR
ncbi:MAG: TetR/AcrR family transcriptional regulator [Burkholderiaceae bacterium]|nr:TetR/AcrR family transcriptional regulator [Burkholderiaceae bacterium]